MKHEPRQAICMEKPLKTAWVALKVGWSRASGNRQGGANSVSQVDEVSDMAPASWLCGLMWGKLRKRKMASAITSAWEKAVPQLSP